MIPSTRVLVAEDSPFLCRLLTVYLEQAGGFEVVGIAHTGREAITRYRELLPDVVALDLMMPDIDGITALREIMAVRPAPVVVITGASGMDAVLTLRALDCGAWDFVTKFDPLMPRSPEATRAEIISKMRKAARKAAGPNGETAPVISSRGEAPANVTVVGASTGGPQALREFLGEIPENFPGALILVQHLPPTFSARLAADLARFCKLPVAEFHSGERLRAGMVRVAPGGAHMLLDANRGASFRAFDGEPDCPSIDMAMETAAAVYGQTSSGVLLSGMGSDGVRGLAAIRQRGGATYVQDPATCVVAGMPGAAIARGLGGVIGPPAVLGQKLAAMVSARGGSYACA